MKKQKKEHGVISIVQSPDEGKNDNVKEKEIVEKNDTDKEKGIISVIQSPEEELQRKIIGN